jgi:hypothetical protein
LRHDLPGAAAIEIIQFGAIHRTPFPIAIYKAPHLIMGGPNGVGCSCQLLCGHA